MITHINPNYRVTERTDQIKAKKDKIVFTKKIFERLKNDNETENTEHFSSTKIESERNESSFHTVRFCDNQVQSYGRGTNNRLIVIREGV